MVVEFQLDGQTHRICVPDGWSGRVGLLLDIHRGHPSRRYRVVKEQVVDPAVERAPD